MADRIESLSPSQREALADFQAITATEDLDTAITILQSHDWDLAVRLFSTRRSCTPSTDPHVSLSRSRSPLSTGLSAGKERRPHEQRRRKSRNAR